MLFVVADPLHVHPLDEWIGTRPSAGPAEHAARDVGPELWTCGMHPEALQSEPGTCPICQMDLVPVGAEAPSHGSAQHSSRRSWSCPDHPMIEESQQGECPICGRALEIQDRGEEHATERVAVTIDPAVIQKMNVTTAPALRRDLARHIRTVGYLAYDEEEMVSITTRYSGFVEKVHVASVGQEVRRDDPLFDVYAPELVQTQQELLTAVDYARSLTDAPDEIRERAEKLVEAARARLHRWEISMEQIRRIEARGEVLRTITVTAPSSGVVMKRMHGLEGMAIHPGMDVIHIANLDQLWLTVEVFEDQLAWVGTGSRAQVAFDALPGERFTGNVRFVEPEVSPTTRSGRLTLEVSNPRRQLRVGMYATVSFEPVAARSVISVPAQSVIRTGARDVVVVALGGGRFEPREVLLGLESDGMIEVRDGLEEDEEVVTSAQFLIDSESNLRAAVQKMVGRMAGHAH
jgi:Cu(I)/Ag(I) efflux system membrane fusion protein/cobalt-zinc-cadmium efflux system membrane fusion protein